MTIRDAYDPEGFRREGHRLVDQLADYLRAALAGEMPVLPWCGPRKQVERWHTDYPERPAADPSASAQGLLSRFIAESIHLHHPHCAGHQVTAPLPLAALCDLAISTLNNSGSVYEMSPAATAIERNLVRWMADRAGFGPAADGVLTSGGSLGNLTALLAARQAKAQHDVWSEGQHERPPLAVLVSEQRHYSVARAVQIMGWGKDAAVAVEVDDRFRLRPEALAEALARARAAGRRPIAVVANACSTSTGSFDPLDAIADFCTAEDLWLHVDGAHGGSALLSDKYRSLLDGVERADSLVWDAHKMMLTPSLVTAVLFRDGSHSHQAFAQDAAYLFEGRWKGTRSDDFDAGRRTMECTRRVVALKVHVALSVYGTAMFGDYVTATFDLAQRFGEMLDAAPDFELALPPQSNIVCFRYRPAGAGDLDALQQDLRRKVVRGGRFFFVQTKLPQGTFLRTTLINPFTTEADLTELLDLVRQAAAR